MCGINGIIQPAEGKTAFLEQDIAAMNRAIRHRGPDGEGSFVGDGVALGHLRLSIIDLSADGAQPMFNGDRSLVLVFNGEIYNYVELRAELQALGYEFHSRTDSEVILHGYAEWGAACVERFRDEKELRMHQLLLVATWRPAGKAERVQSRIAGASGSISSNAERPTHIRPANPCKWTRCA